LNYPVICGILAKVVTQEEGMMKKPLPPPYTAPKPHLTISNSRQNVENPLGSISREALSIVLGFASLQDCIKLSLTCKTLYLKSQANLLRKFQGEKKSQLGIVNLSYLADALDLDPHLSQHGFNFPQLSRVLTRGRFLLDSLVTTDPNVGWKLLSVDGRSKAVEEILDDKLFTTFDNYGNCFLSYHAAGDHVGYIERTLRSHPELAKGRLDKIARMAALGGGIRTLKFLKSKLNYNLATVYTASSGDYNDETLLTLAVQGGDEATINFLEEQSIAKDVGVNLARIASLYGHVKLYTRYSREIDPLDEQLDETELLDNASELAQNAVRTGNLDPALALIAKYKIVPRALAAFVIQGGDRKVFWHFINNGLFSLTTRFANNATVEHLLAEEGHLTLLQEVLNDPRATNGLDALDEHNKSILHYCAMGGHYDIYCFVSRLAERKKIFLRLNDDFGNNPALSAAREGRVWFLKRLNQTEAGKKLIHQKDNYGATILNIGTHCGDPNFLQMIIEELNIDVRSLSNRGYMAVHDLACLAIERKPYYWKSVVFILENYGPDMLDAPMDGTSSLREFIIEFNAEKYIPDPLLAPNAADIFYAKKRGEAALRLA
jgi:hypothetical protein